jgi:hypothetical protein
MQTQETQSERPTEKAPPINEAAWNALFARLRKAEQRIKELEHRQSV